MDPIRRHLLKAAGLFVASRAFANDQQGTNMQPSSVKPRHVLCFLGKDDSLLHPPMAVARTIATRARQTSVDWARHPRWYF